MSTPGAKPPSSSAPPQVTGPAVTAQPIGFSRVTQYAGSGNISVTAQMVPGQVYRGEGVPGTTVNTFGVPNSVGTGQPFGPSAAENRDRMFSQAISGTVGPLGGGVPPPTVVSSIGGMPFNRSAQPVFVQRTGLHGEGSPIVSEGGVSGDPGMPTTNRVLASMAMSGPPRVSWNEDVRMCIHRLYPIIAGGWTLCAVQH